VSGMPEGKGNMSMQELVDAYLHGRISRRDFVKRLTIAGVSVGAASAYAISLSSPAAARGIDHSSPGYARLNQESDYDSDGDGVSDLDELACGSDWQDPESVCEAGGGPTATPGDPGDPTPTPGGSTGGPVTDLPSTGTGSSANSNGEWWKPAAILGVGAAAVATKFRRKSSAAD
jgi:hypothetical protein